MGRILPSILEQDIVVSMDANEIDFMFKMYDRCHIHGSTEGLGKIGSNIAIAFGDFIIRTGANIKVSVTGMFKDIKRSSLQITMASNRLGMMRLMKADYTQLSPTVCAMYPFTKDCKTVAMYCKDTFTLIDMNRRMTAIIEEYMHLGAAIRSGDIPTCIVCLGKLNNLNMKAHLDIKSVLPGMVAGQSNKNYTTFGEVFNSVSEYRDAIGVTLLCVDELDVALKTEKLLDHLYKAYEKLKDSVSQAAASSSFDLGKIGGLAGTI